MAASDAKPIAMKNQALRITLTIYDADGDPVTSAAGLDSEVSLDAAAFGDCTNEATEIANGFYYLELTAAEMNADTVAVAVKTSTAGAKQTNLVFYPAEASEIQVNVKQISDDSTAADNLELVTEQTRGVALIDDAITAAKIAADAITSSELAASAATEIADAVLKRGMVYVEDAADTTSLAAVVLGILESGVSGSNWVIRKTTGATFVTKTLTTDPAADPITGVT